MLQRQNLWKPEMKLGCNPFQGVCYLIYHNEPYELVKCVDSLDGTFTFEPQFSTLQEIGIAKEMAEGIPGLDGCSMGMNANALTSSICLRLTGEDNRGR
eukprot:9484307-Pyramimonas_sp.AAC.1